MTLDITGSIDPTDPLLEHFALQHDMRERFLHALEEIVGVVEVDMSDQTVNVVVVLGEILDRVVTIAKDAIDETKLIVWNNAGRPLPWMDEKINPLAAKVRADVLRSLGIPEAVIRGQ